VIPWEDSRDSGNAREKSNGGREKFTQTEQIARADESREMKTISIGNGLKKGKHQRPVAGPHHGNQRKTAIRKKKGGKRLRRLNKGVQPMDPIAHGAARKKQNEKNLGDP